MRLGKILVKPNYQIPKKFTCLNCPIRLMKREKTVLSINQPLIVPPLCSFWSNLLIRNHVFYLYYYFVVTNGCSYIPSLYIIRDIGSSAFHRKMFLVTINSNNYWWGPYTILYRNLQLTEDGYPPFNTQVWILINQIILQLNKKSKSENLFKFVSECSYLQFSSATNHEICRSF